MKGKETLKALIEGKILRDSQGLLYKLDRDTDTVQCSECLDHDWKPALITLTEFCEEETVEHLEKDYPLSFFEAVSRIFSTDNTMVPYDNPTKSYRFELVMICEATGEKRVTELGDDLIECGWRIEGSNEPAPAPEEKSRVASGRKESPDTTLLRREVLEILSDCHEPWVNAWTIAKTLFENMHFGREWYGRISGHDGSRFSEVTGGLRHVCTRKVHYLLRDLEKKGLVEVNPSFMGGLGFRIR